MKIEVKDNYEEVSQRAAELVARELLLREEPVMGLPTGGTPKKMYDILVTYYEKGLVDFSKVTTFNLDEYYPISKNDPESFNRYMEERFVSKVNIKNENYHIFNGEIDEDKTDSHCRNYEKSIKEAGGIDLTVLGIGENGHIAFNEPGTDFSAISRKVKLNKETIENGFEDVDSAPKEALTMGIKTITHSTKILLLASGDHKARAIEEAISGPVTRDCPASVLQLHPEVTFLLDEEAGKRISLNSKQGERN